MLELRRKLKVRHGASAVKLGGRLRLPLASRLQSRLDVTLESGEPATLALPRGECLRGGDLVVASDGRVIEIVAAPEALLNVSCDSPVALARVAYHLGSQHVAVEVGDGALRGAADPALETLLAGLGALVTPIEAPFDPEAGLWNAAHHQHDEGHDHGHDHDHAHCGHDHGHGHRHG